MNRREIRDLERSSIRSFVQNNSVYLEGRVLDYGCGMPHTCVKPQPYLDIVESVHARMGRGEYVAWDLDGSPFPEGHFDCVLMTQVLQFETDPEGLIRDLRGIASHLVMTYPTHWEEVERNDLWRFTKAGVERMLKEAGWTVERHMERWSLPFEDFRLAGGYGVVAR